MRPKRQRSVNISNNKPIVKWSWPNHALTGTAPCVPPSSYVPIVTYYRLLPSSRASYRFFSAELTPVTRHAVLLASRVKSRIVTKRRSDINDRCIQLAQRRDVSITLIGPQYRLLKEKALKMFKPVCCQLQRQDRIKGKGAGRGGIT